MTLTSETDTENAENTEPAEASARTRRPLPRPGLPLVAAGLALVLAVAALAGLLMARGDLQELKTHERRRTEALEAARNFAVALTSYDYRHLAADVAKVNAGAGGKFKEDYELASGAQFQKLVNDNKATSVGSVVSAGIVSATDVRAVVLLAVDQKITNIRTPQGRTDPNRVVLTLERIGGKWLVTDVKVNVL